MHAIVETPETIPQAVQRARSVFADVEAMVDGDIRLSYAQLGEAIEQAQRAAMAAGIQRGDRVAVWAPNIHEWVIAAMGAACAGAALVPLNTRYKGDEAAYILNRSQARVLFTVNGFLGNDYVDLLRAATVEVPHLERIVVLRGDVSDGTTSWADFLAAGEAVPLAEAEERAASITADDLADILFTSGTTGRPKGVMIAHGQDMKQYADYADIVGIGEAGRYLQMNPYFHAFGYKAGILSSILRGATMIPLQVFTADSLMALVQQERVTVLPGPPTLFQTMLDHPQRGDYDLSSLELAITGAAVVPVEMVKRMRSEMTFKTIITAYGLTEAAGTATACRAEDDAETIAQTSGRAIPGVEVRIAAEDGTEVARGDAGEILIRGYNVMLGYLDDPDETAKAIDADGWLHTGDIGTMDERGYVVITDRMKDMFIVGGFNAYPAEIENLLLANEEIGQVAVIGVPDERLGEVGMAFVVARPGHDLEPEALRSWAVERMANYKVPRRFVVLDELPLNASGKVSKPDLRAQAAAQG